MLQPILFKKFIRSFISGSIAQLLKVVLPFAKDAAIIKFSVAPTEILGNRIFAPVKPFGAEAWTYPCMILYLTPSLDNDFKWISIGLVPIAHPPGNETFAIPNFANKGPRTNIPARIVLTKLYEANFLFCFELSITISFLSNLIIEPNDRSKDIIVWISFTFGKFFKKIFFLDNKVAANIGKEAFFEPDILIWPLSLFAPKTSNLCIVILLVMLHQFGPYIYLFYRRKLFLAFHFLLKK